MGLNSLTRALIVHVMLNDNNYYMAVSHKDWELHNLHI